MLSIQLEQLADDIGTFLKENGLVLATAESCTGGGVSYYITSVAGSSDWFDRAFVTYSNDAKADMLWVNVDTLNQYGAVSEQVAKEMADGAIKNSNADISVAITGIAGPDGGSKDKPVGTVWLAWARKGCQTRAKLTKCSGDRQSVREQTIANALNGLLTM